MNSEKTTTPEELKKIKKVFSGIEFTTSKVWKGNVAPEGKVFYIGIVKNKGGRKYAYVPVNRATMNEEEVQQLLTDTLNKK